MSILLPRLPLKSNWRFYLHIVPPEKYFSELKFKMRLAITFLFLALRLVSVLVLPQSEALEYSTLGGIEPFNTIFAEEHLVHWDGPVLDPAAITSHGLYPCYN